MQATRRALLTCGLGLLGACALPNRVDDTKGSIDALVASGPVPAAGLVVRRGGKTVFAHAAGHAGGLESGGGPLRPFGVDTRMRVASVSKLGVAMTAHRLADAGLLDLDAPLSDWFGDALTHPDYPETDVPVRSLMSHTSGLRDPDIYWMPAPGRIEDLFSPWMWQPGRPGGYFLYCNFGFGILATVLERVTGERFDLVAQRLVLDPAGMQAGYNWSGVPAEARRTGATLYVKQDEAWQVLADGPDKLSGDGPAILAEPEFRLEDYEVGSNGTLFSPQGGLRANLPDLCSLVRMAAQHPRAPQPAWVFDPANGNGDTDFGYFSVYGEGPQIHPATDSPVPGVRLIGHHGEAYGLYSGAWHAPDLDAEIAYAVTGTSGDEPPRSPLHRTANLYTEPLLAQAAMSLRL